MGRALLILGVLATVGLAAAAALGYALHGTADAAVPRHVLVALGSSLILLFSHCWILLYLLATGRAIAEVVREHGVEPSVLGTARGFQKRVAPPLLLATAFAIATLVLGGGVLAGTRTALVHHALFWITLAVQLWALWVERRVLGENERLLADLDRRLTAASSVSPASPTSPAGA